MRARIALPSKPRPPLPQQDPSIWTALVPTSGDILPAAVGGAVVAAIFLATGI